jgi:hypothetical protein
MYQILYERIKHVCIVIASDPALAGERGNPAKSLQGHRPCLHAEVAI